MTKDNAGAARVRHPSYGEGDVVNTRWNGAQLRLRLNSGTEVWVASGSVQPIAVNIVPDVPKPAPAAKQHTPTPTVPRPRPKPTAQLQARRMIEAFRMGIVPADDVTAFTVGREEERRRMLQVLTEDETDGAGFAVLVEDYGGGKTHFIEYLYRDLPARGYAVARVAFNMSDNAPFLPQNVYHEFTTSLRYNRGNDEIGNFRTLMREHARAGTRLQHEIFGPALEILSAPLDEDEDESLFEWLEGEPAPKSYLRSIFARGLPRMYGAGTATDNYCNFLSVISQLVKDAGMRGLVLLVDEAEYMWRAPTNTRQEQCLNLLGGLLYLGQSGKATFNNYGTTPWQLRHSGQRPMDFLDAEGSGLFVLFAFAQQSQYLAADDSRTLSLRSFVGERAIEIVRGVEGVYQRAYPGSRSLPDDIREGIAENGEGRARYLMKASTEALDLLRIYPRLTSAELFDSESEA